jgi:protein-tyrosine phosphatase
MVPPIDAALPVLEGWRQSLVDGRGLAVHCWGSVGRSPTLAAALLALGGISPEESWRRIEEARGRDVPDTLEQRRWVAEIALRAGVRSSKGIKATCDG